MGIKIFGFRALSRGSTMDFPGNLAVPQLVGDEVTSRLGQHSLRRALPSNKVIARNYIASMHVVCESQAVIFKPDRE